MIVASGLKHRSVVRLLAEIEPIKKMGTGPRADSVESGMRPGSRTKEDHLAFEQKHHPVGHLVHRVQADLAKSDHPHVREFLEMDRVAGGFCTIKAQAIGSKGSWIGMLG